MNPLYKSQESLFLASGHINIEQNRNNAKDRNENTPGNVKIISKLQGMSKVTKARPNFELSVKIGAKNKRIEEQQKKRHNSSFTPDSYHVSEK